AAPPPACHACRRPPFRRRAAPRAAARQTKGFLIPDIFLQCFAAPRAPSACFRQPSNRPPPGGRTTRCTCFPYVRRCGLAHRSYAIDDGHALRLCWSALLSLFPGKLLEKENPTP